MVARVEFLLKHVELKGQYMFGFMRDVAVRGLHIWAYT
jgi:hypothetical protein